VLRITVFPDGKEWITGRNLPQDLVQKRKQGITANLAKSEFYRSLPSHKTGNYLTAWQAKIYAQNINSQEAIFTDAQGNWLETTTGNLWGWKDDSWWTPPLDAGILPGIVREHLITFLRNQQYTVYQEPWTKELVELFEAIAYSNCVVETVPIHTVIQPERQLEYNPHHICLKQLENFFSI
jgi:4-amino-4-deoxychorismate lyase